MQSYWSKPAQVVRNPALSTDEKRALLASWASDAQAVEDAPALRRLEDGTVLHIDNILDALKAIDQPRNSTRPVRHWRLAGSKHRVERPDDDDPPPPTPAAAPSPKEWVFELMTPEARAA